MARTSIDATYAMNRLHFLKDDRIVLGRERAGGTRRAGRVGSEYEGRQALSLAAGRVARVMAPHLMELIRVEGEIDKDGAEGRAGPESVLPWPDVHAWRPLSAD